MITETVQFDRPLTNAVLADTSSSRVRGTVGSSSDSDLNFPTTSANTKDQTTASRAEEVQREATVLAETVLAAERHELEQAQATALASIAAELNRLNLQSGETVEKFSELAIKLAATMTRVALRSNSSLVTERLAALLDEATQNSEPIINFYVEPGQLEPLQERFNELKSQLDSEKRNFEIVSDADLGPGDCRVEYSAYEFVGSLEQQINDLEHRMKEALDV